MIVKLYENIQSAIGSDPLLLSLMQLDPADPVSIYKHIEKRMKPQNLASESLPLIAFYATPGGGLQRSNDRVYDAIMVFDTYTQDDVSLAFDISQRLVDMFHGEISPFQDIENFETLLISQHESESDAANTFCFTTVLKFSFVMDK